MGARGPNARAVTKRAKGAAAPPRPAVQPWDASWLSRAERVIAFVETLQVTAGPLAGQRFALMDWQKALIEDWYRVDADGKRIVRTAVLSVGRKNGKSTLVAAIALAHLLGPEREPRGQVVIGASDRDQSGIIFAEVCAILEADEALRDLVNIQSHAKTITVHADGSVLQALSSDAKKAHGLSPTLCILDELGQWGVGIGIRLYNALMTAGGGRSEPLKIVISTQADSDLAKMSELLDYGRQVNEGVIDNPRFACKLFEVPDGLDPFDEAHWPLANPALGTFRSLEDMRELAERARRMPTERAAFEQLFLNRRTAAEERWISKPDWDACKGFVDPAALEGQVCYGGLDLGSVSDLTSLSLFWPETGALMSWSWCPADRIAERVENDRAPYNVWADAGWLELTPGKATDKRHVALRLAEICARFKPKVVMFDKWGMPELARILDEESITLPLVEHRQGFVSMSPSSKAFEELVLNARLRHDNPLLTWTMSNVRVARDPAGNIKPDKQRSRERIDPIVAGIMAVGAWASEAREDSERIFSDDLLEGVFRRAA